MKNPLGDTSILLVGKNCGPSKMATMIETGNTIMDEEAFENIIGEEWKVGEYIRRFKLGLCPKCGSANTVLNTKNDITFWGCVSCEYGFWEKYLPDDIIKKFCENMEIQYVPRMYANFLTPRKSSKKKKQMKRKSNNSDGSQQLSLF